MKDKLRVAVRPEDSDGAFEPPDFDVPDGVPARTKDGDPWVRWVRYGDYSGWYAVGSRKPELSGHTFWAMVFHAACVVTGGNLDQAHCCGAGVLSLGGLGVTLRSGLGQILLHQCLLTNPERYLEVMAPVIHATGVYTKRVSVGAPAIVLCDADGNRIEAEEHMRAAVLGGSDGIKWKGKQKERTRLWVSCCSKLLRDDRMDAAQAAFAALVMPELLTQATKQLVRWPRQGMGDAWQYTREQQVLWALVLILGLEDEEQTERLVSDCLDSTGRPDAAYGALCGMRTRVVASEYTQTFQSRLGLALAKLQELFRVELPGGDA